MKLKFLKIDFHKYVFEWCFRIFAFARSWQLAVFKSQFCLVILILTLFSLIFGCDDSIIFFFLVNFIVFLNIFYLKVYKDYK